MRRNAFRDAYCTSVVEVLNELMEKDVDVSDIYLSEVNGPEGDETMWCGDVSENASGDPVLYIEAVSADAVRAIAKDAGIEDQSA